MVKNMIVEEFITHITTFESVDNILDTCTNQSEKGFIYERLWDVCIKFGFCNHFQKSDFTHMIGNMNNGNLKPLTTFTHYLTEKVVSGNANFMSMTARLAAGTTISSTSTFLGSFSYVYPSSSPDQQYVGLEAVGRNGEFYYGWASFTDLGGIMTLNDAAFNTTAGASITVAADTAAIPEPSTYALFGIGTIGLLMVLRRKRTA